MRIRIPIPSDLATANRSATKERSYSPGLGSSRFHGAEISMRVTPIFFRSAAHSLNVARSQHGCVQSQRSTLNSRGTGWVAVEANVVSVTKRTCAKTQAAAARCLIIVIVFDHAVELEVQLREPATVRARE